MSFFDDVSRKVKDKAEEWDVHGKAEKFAAEVDRVAHEAKDKAAEYADDNRGRIREGLDKAGATIDERTDGKYADKVARAKGKVSEGVDKLAEQRSGGATPPTTPPATPSSTGYATGAASGAGGSAYPPGPYTPEPYTPDPIDRPEPIHPEEPTSGTGWPEEQPPRP
jgi:MT0933-like antitoxin protein